MLIPIRKVSKVISFMALTMLVATACSAPTTPAQPSSGSDTKSTEVKNAAPSAEKKVLRVLVGTTSVANETLKANMDKIVKKFEELNPGIQVKLESTDTMVEHGKLTTMLNSGVEPPNVININAGPGRINVLASGNLIRPLDDMYAKDGWKDKVNPAAYNFIQGSKIYEVPNTLDSIEIYYNKDIFEKLGLKAPTTSEEFNQDLQKIKDGGYTPIALGARDGYAVGWIFSDVLESVAGRKAVENVLYGDGKWNSPEFVKAAETFADWVNKGYLPKESATLADNDARARFLDKKAAITFMGTWFIPDVIDKKIDSSVGSFMLPSYTPGTTAYPTGGLGNSWVIPAQVKDVDLSEKWMNYVLSEDYAKVAFDNPANSSIIASKAASSVPPTGKLLAKAMKDIESSSGYNPSVFIGPQAKEAYYQNLQGLIGGLVSPKQAMDNIEAAAEKDRQAGYKLTKK